MEHHQTPIDWQWNTNTVNCRTSTVPSAMNSIRGIWHNCTLGQGALTSEVLWPSETEGQSRDGKWEKNPACAGSMPGKKFSVDKDIRLSVLPFVCLVVHLTHRIFLSQFFSHHLSCQGHSFLHTISLLFVFRWYILSIIVVRINKSFVLLGNLGLDPLRLTTRYLFKTKSCVQ